jgi:hypothetical protein
LSRHNLNLETTTMTDDKIALREPWRRAQTRHSCACRATSG